MPVRIKNYGSTTFVTGMRAFAALWVVLIHTGGGGLRSLGPVGNSLADLGRGGVYAFFVISGFSVSASYGKAGGYRRYLFLRFMRLAPLYYFWLVVYGLCLGRSGYWARSHGLPGLFFDILAHLTFLHAFFMPVANSMIGVEWSLSVEMFWYLCLPGLWYLARHGKGWVLVTLAFASYLANHLVIGQHATTGTQMRLGDWNPFVYFLCYALGVWALRLRDAVLPQHRQNGVWLAFALLAAYASVPLFFERFRVDMMPLVSLSTFLLLVYGSNEDAICRHLFMSKLVLVLGTLSYGIYLAHLLMNNFFSGVFAPGASGDLMRFLAVAASTSFIAWGTYKGIEGPSERWSKRSFRL
jgi:peptidoglycan/LPS O-acetylase OafA/YrhL